MDAKSEFSTASASRKAAASGSLARTLMFAPTCSRSMPISPAETSRLSGVAMTLPE